MADGVRGTQHYIENIFTPSPDPTVRVTQHFIENIFTPVHDPSLRVTHHYVENIFLIAAAAPASIFGLSGGQMIRVT